MAGVLGTEAAIALGDGGVPTARTLSGGEAGGLRRALGRDEVQIVLLLGDLAHRVALLLEREAADARRLGQRLGLLGSLTA